MDAFKQVEEWKETGKYSRTKKCATIEEFLHPHNDWLTEEKAAEYRLKRAKLLEAMEDIKFWEMNSIERGELIGVTHDTIGKWMVAIPDAYMNDVLKRQREAYAARSIEVDSALYRESVKEGGDAKHKELYYRRMENWTPQQALELSRGKDKEIQDVPTVELVKGLMGTLTPEQKKQVLEGEGSSGDPGTGGT